MLSCIHVLFSYLDADAAMSNISTALFLLFLQGFVLCLVQKPMSVVNPKSTQSILRTFCDHNRILFRGGFIHSHTCDRFFSLGFAPRYVCSLFVCC